MVRVHAEDGDKGVPREIVYGLVSEGNPFTPFFNISETSGKRTIAFEIMKRYIDSSDISFDGKKETLKKLSMEYSNIKWRNIKMTIFITSDSSSTIVGCQPYDRKQRS